jgi:hypothetical protein
MTDKMRGQTSGGLLDHPPIKAALEDKAASYWLRDLLASAASRARARFNVFSRASSSAADARNASRCRSSFASSAPAF